MELAVSASAFLRDQILAEGRGYRSSPQIDAAIMRASDLAYNQRLNEDHYAEVLTGLHEQRSTLPEARTVAQRIPEKVAMWKAEGRSRFTDHVRARMPADKRAEYLKRRREMAAFGYVPPKIAGFFSTGALASLCIVAMEVAKGNRCTLHIEKIAALAGVCHATVRRALQKARELGFLQIVYRPNRAGEPSDTNIVTVSDKSWRDWIGNRRRGTTTVKNYLRKQAENAAGLFFSAISKHQCNPTQYKKIITGNRLAADYEIASITLGKCPTPSILSMAAYATGPMLRKE